jgi:hypothetical protein
MTSIRILSVTASLFLMFAGSSVAQEYLRGPSLGLVHDPMRKTLRPMLGVPGAAVLGDPLPLDFAVEMAAVAPAGSYALLRASGAPDLRLLRSTAEGHFVESIAGAIEEADRIVLGAAAWSAGAYHRGSKRLQLLRGLPWEPAVSREIDVSLFGGEVTAFAVSDDARTALVAFSTDETSNVWIFPPDGDPKSVLAAGRVVSISFIPESSDALIVDERQQAVYLLNSENATTVVAGAADGIEAPIAAQSARNRRFVYIAAAGNGRILILNTEDGSRRELTCPCSLQVLAQMSDETVFRLGEVSEGPMWLLDATSAEPRLVFVPPSRSEQE